MKMSKITYTPTGYYILVEVDAVDETHDNSIIVRVDNERKREFGGRDIGVIKAIGPIAFQGYADCKGAEDWGCKVGDRVEFNKYDGKTPSLAETNSELAGLRIINDNDIIAVISHE